jgi:hypothetical protein
MKRGFIVRSVDSLSLSHNPITIRAEADVDSALLLVAHISGDVACANPNVARLVGDPWLDLHGILDHWDVE